MPPPRLLRPLRPYHLKWSSTQVRWASDGPRDRLQAHHDDPVQASNAAEEAHYRGLNEEHAKQTVETGWLGSLFGRASGLFNKQPSVASNEQPLPPRVSNTDPAETLPIKHDKETEHRRDETWETECEGLPPIYQESPIRTQYRNGKGRESRIPSSCSVCQEKFPSSKKLQIHTLFSDRCGVLDSVYKYLYFCRLCHMRFDSVAEARHHFKINPVCLSRMSMAQVPLHEDIAQGSQLERIQHVTKAARRRYLLLARVLFEAAESINAMPSPKIREIAGGTVKHLLRLEKGAQRDGKAYDPVRTKKTSTIPQPQSKSSSKTPADGKTLIRKHLALKGHDPSKHPGVPIAANRTQQGRGAAQSTTEARSSSTSNQNELGRRDRSLRSDTEEKRQKSSAPEQSAQAVPDIALSPNPNTALVLQLQQLVEHVRLLTEKLLPLSLPVNTDPLKQTNTETVRSSSIDHSPVLPGTDSSDHSRGLSVSKSVQSPTTSSNFEFKTPLPKEPGPVTRLPSKEGKTQKRLELVRSQNRSPEVHEYAPVHQEAAQHDPSSPEPSNASRTQDSFIDESKPSFRTSNSCTSARIEPRLSQRKEKQRRQQESTSSTQENAEESVPLDLSTIYESRSDNQRLTRQIHTQARLMKSSNYSQVDSSDASATSSNQPTRTPARPGASPVPATSASSEMSEQSLLDELFPESSSYIQPHYSERHPYPKLDLPSSVPVVRRKPYDRPMSEREKVIQSFKRSSENIIALQLLHCSTELAEADFRRLVPKGKHIEGWTRDGEFTKVIPGRDPLSLERLPFYYLLFKSQESALAYQKNVSRLHKLSQLHQPSTIMSPIPPPRGFLEEGEDINLATSSYLLQPIGLPLNLNMIMQPYNASLRALIEQGGYKPIVPFTGTNGKPIYKVLMHIEGYEPSQMDLYQLLAQEGYTRGIQWPFHNEHAGIHRLRDITDLRARLLPVSSSNPRAANPYRHRSVEDDPSLSFLTHSSEEGEDATQIKQMIMNRVYNRWIIEFEDEEAAKRFARLWNRRVLPVSRSAKHVTWRDTEERRMCNTEFLW